MRRGEALALRWRDVDLDAGRLTVRRSVGVVKDKGAGERLVGVLGRRLARSAESP
jgi:integrase